jgi:hypothetical protein
MAKPIITLNGLKIVIMLGMLVIILTGVRFAADIIVPFILALFIAVILNPLVQRMTRLRIPRAGDHPAYQHHYCCDGLLVAYLGPRSMNWRERCRNTVRRWRYRCCSLNPGCSAQVLKSRLRNS